MHPRIIVQAVLYTAFCLSIILFLSTFHVVDVPAGERLLDGSINQPAPVVSFAGSVGTRGSESIGSPESLVPFLLEALFQLLDCFMTVRSKCVLLFSLCIITTIFSQCVAFSCKFCKQQEPLLHIRKKLPLMRKSYKVWRRVFKKAARGKHFVMPHQSVLPVFTLHTDTVNLQAQLDAVQRENGTLHRYNASLEGQIEQLRGDLQTMQHKLASYKTRFKTLKANFQQMLAEEVEKHQRLFTEQMEEEYKKRLAAAEASPSSDEVLERIDAISYESLMEKHPELKDNAGLENTRTSGVLHIRDNNAATTLDAILAQLAVDQELDPDFVSLHNAIQDDRGTVRRRMRVARLFRYYLEKHHAQAYKEKFQDPAEEDIINFIYYMRLVRKYAYSTTSQYSAALYMFYKREIRLDPVKQKLLSDIIKEAVDAVRYECGTDRKPCLPVPAHIAYDVIPFMPTASQRAYTSILYAVGCRPLALASVRLKDVSIDTHNHKIYVIITIRFDKYSRSKGETKMERNVKFSSIGATFGSVGKHDPVFQLLGLLREHNLGKKIDDFLSAITTGRKVALEIPRRTKKLFIMPTTYETFSRCVRRNFRRLIYHHYPQSVGEKIGNYSGRRNFITATSTHCNVELGVLQVLYGHCIGSQITQDYITQSNLSNFNCMDLLCGGEEYAADSRKHKFNQATITSWDEFVEKSNKYYSFIYAGSSTYHCFLLENSKRSLDSIMDVSFVSDEILDSDSDSASVHQQEEDVNPETEDNDDDSELDEDWDIVEQNATTTTTTTTTTNSTTNYTSLPRIDRLPRELNKMIAKDRKKFHISSVKNWLSLFFRAHPDLQLQLERQPFDSSSNRKMEWMRSYYQHKIVTEYFQADVNRKAEDLSLDRAWPFVAPTVTFDTKKVKCSITHQLKKFNTPYDKELQREWNASSSKKAWQKIVKQFKKKDGTLMAAAERALNFDMTQKEDDDRSAREYNRIIAKLKGRALETLPVILLKQRLMMRKVTVDELKPAALAEANQTSKVKLPFRVSQSVTLCDLPVPRPADEYAFQRIPNGCLLLYKRIKRPKKGEKGKGGKTVYLLLRRISQSKWKVWESSSVTYEKENERDAENAAEEGALTTGAARFGVKLNLAKLDENALLMSKIQEFYQGLDDDPIDEQAETEEQQDTSTQNKKGSKNKTTREKKRAASRTKSKAKKLLMEAAMEDDEADDEADQRDVFMEAAWRPNEAEDRQWAADVANMDNDWFDDENEEQEEESEEFEAAESAFVEEEFEEFEAAQSAFVEEFEDAESAFVEEESEESESLTVHPVTTRSSKRKRVLDTPKAHVSQTAVPGTVIRSRKRRKIVDESVMDTQ